MRYHLKLILLSIVTLAASLSSSCKKDGEGKADGKFGACDRIEASSVCTQFGEGNFAAAGEEYLRNFCTQMEGTFSLKPCPAENQVGSCLNPEGTKVRYSIGGFPTTPEKAKEQCSHPWQPAN